MKKIALKAPANNPKQKTCGLPEPVRRAAAVLLCMLTILSLCSCWSRRELNTLAIVLATAVDVGKKPDELKVTVQIVSPGEIKSGPSSSGGGAAKKAYANIDNTDKSVISALSGFSHITNRSMYFSHNRILIFSREVAQKDIMESLDAFTRNFETRMNVYLLISKDTASDMLDEEIELEQMPANHIAEMLQAQHSNSETAIITLLDFDIATLSASTAPVAPMIEMYEVDGKKKSRLEGTAVFKQGKMIGELNVTQTRGLIWATGKAKKTTITIDTKDGKVDLLVIHAEGSMKPVKAEDGTIRMKLKIQAEGNIESNETEKDMSSAENTEMLTKLAEEYIRADIQSALKQARVLSADVFGFGEAIRRDYPKDWEKMKENWDKQFKTLEIDMELDVKIASSGGMGKPVAQGGAE